MSQWLTDHWLSLKLAIVENSVFYEPWGYLVVETNGFRSSQRIADELVLRNPLDCMTWVIGTICYAIVSFLMVIHSFLWISANLSVTRVLIIDATIGPFRLFGSILEQSSCEATKTWSPLGLNRFSNCGLWILWYLTMYLLSQAYKGTVFKQMTVSRDIAYPKSLHEVADRNISLVTFTAESQHAYYWISQIKQSLLDVIESGTYPNYYVQLTNLIRDRGRWSGLHDLQAFSAELYLKENGLLGNTRESEFSELTLDIIGEIDLIRNIRVQKLIIETLSPNTWSSPVIPLQSFMSCSPWATGRSFMNHLLRDNLGLIYESGLYNKWRAMNDDIDEIRSLYMVDRILMHEYGIKNVDYAIQRNQWRNYRAFRKAYPNAKFPKKPFAISFKVVALTFKLCLCLVGTSGLVLLLELFHLYIEQKTYLNLTDKIE